MLKKIALVVLVLVGVLVVVIATRPSTFTVTRSTTIAAPPAAVYAQVADLKAWERWSPWERVDPALRRTYGEVSSGIGALYHWSGDGHVGEGTMTITEAKPPEHLGLDLDFTRPMAGQCRVTFGFVPAGAATTVTWSMSGRNGFVAKAASLVMDMDAMIGGQFEQGLAQLKTVCEVAPASVRP